MPNEGTQNRAKGKRFQLAVNAALEKRGPDQWQALVAVADKLVERAMEGDSWAIKEVADRIEGKAAQQINLADADGEKLQVSLVINGLKDAGG